MCSIPVKSGSSGGGVSKAIAKTKSWYSRPEKGKSEVLINHDHRTLSTFTQFITGFNLLGYHQRTGSGPYIPFMSWGDRRRLAPNSWLPSFDDKKACDLQSRDSTTRSSMGCLAGCSIHISESNEQTAQSCGGRSKLLKLSSLITDRWSIGNRVMITTYWGPTLDKLSTPLESNLWWIIVGSKSANQQQQQQQRGVHCTCQTFNFCRFIRHLLPQRFPMDVEN